MTICNYLYGFLPHFLLEIDRSVRPAALRSYICFERQRKVSPVATYEE
jgi:hypothetical protein